MTERPDTLGDLSHTNPYTGAVFGDTQTYSRGRTVAADGGTETDGEAQGESETETETLADVEHAGGDGNASQRTFDRGGGR